MTVFYRLGNLYKTLLSLQRDAKRSRCNPDAAWILRLRAGWQAVDAGLYRGFFGGQSAGM